MRHILLAVTVAMTSILVTDVEGTLNGNDDSLITIPIPAVVAPRITSLIPTSGQIGQLVTVTGSNFGASRGSSTVAFNGAAAAMTGWSTTAIEVAVPPDATSALVYFSASETRADALRQLNAQQRARLVSFLRSVGVTRDDGDVRVYRGPWVTMSGETGQIEIGLTRNELGRWVIFTW